MLRITSLVFYRIPVTPSTLVGKTPKENKSDLPQLRVKMRYQTVDILPIASYNPLVKVLYTH